MIKNEKNPAFGVLLRGTKVNNSYLKPKSAGEPSRRASQQRHFPTGGVRSKKFEQISPKICRADGPACRQAGFPPDPPSASGGEATISDLPAGRQVGRFQVFPCLAGRQVWRKIPFILNSKFQRRIKLFLI